MKDSIRSKLGFITIRLTDNEKLCGYRNYSVVPIRFVNNDGDIFLEYKVMLYDRSGLTEKSYYKSAGEIEPVSMDKLIDIHNKNCDAQGITKYEGEWTRAKNRLKMYESEEVA